MSSNFVANPLGCVLIVFAKSYTHTSPIHIIYDLLMNETQEIAWPIINCLSYWEVNHFLALIINFYKRWKRKKKINRQKCSSHFFFIYLVVLYFSFISFFLMKEMLCYYNISFIKTFAHDLVCECTSGWCLWFLIESKWNRMTQHKTFDISWHLHRKQCQ